MIIHDNGSVGYDFRDLQAVLLFLTSFTETAIIYTDERNVELFKSSLPASTQFMAYSARQFPTEIIEGLEQNNLVVSFQECVALSGVKTMECGHPVIDDTYMTAPQYLVQQYRELLQNLAVTLPQYPQHTVVFAVVAGLKPISDSGTTPTEKQLEGARQTFNFNEIAKVLKPLQDSLNNLGIALIPISAQYGDVAELTALFAEVSEAQNLRYPIQLVKAVDWSNGMEQQAAFFTALHQRAKNLDLPSVVFGNAATYQHLQLGVTGGFDISAVAIHSYPTPPEKDGRDYWKELAVTRSNFGCFQQPADQSGNWNDVTTAMTSWLFEQISSF